MNVIQINGVVNTVVDQLVKEAHNALENPDIMRVAVNAALSNLSPKGNEKK